LELWNSNIIEAPLTATLLIKPNELSIEEVENLVKAINFDNVADRFKEWSILRTRNNEKA
jgi:3-methyladenine DNA glycosylase AlkD